MSNNLDGWERCLLFIHIIDDKKVLA